MNIIKLQLHKKKTLTHYIMQLVVVYNGITIYLWMFRVNRQTGEKMLTILNCTEQQYYIQSRNITQYYLNKVKEMEKA